MATEAQRHKDLIAREIKKLRASVALWLFLLCGFCLLCASVANTQMPGTPVSELRIGLARPGGGYTVVSMPVETYVARVLDGEAARKSPLAALEALAITIRTFAFANRNRHRADGFDLCDQTHCQVVGTATATTERAAQATAGELLLYNGAPASVYYTASCGGRTEKPSNVWPGADDPSYLPSKDDDACGGVPAWNATLGERDLLRALRAAGFRGDRLRELRVLSRDESGRVARLKVDGLDPDQISGQDLRVVVGRTLGWQFIKSTAFDLRREGGAYRFDGRGSGHGVGLCVIGSTQLAARGQSALEILARYFPGLRVSTPGTRIVAAPPASSQPARTSAPSRLVPASVPDDVFVSLADGDEGERDGIARLVASARSELARELGVSPSRLTLRFHATADEYERATNRPWFSLGAVVQGEVHMPPLALLRERDLLDRTIRRGIVHVMTDAVLARRPAWVREGAAIYFAEDRPAAIRAVRPDAGGSCPDDNELLAPISAGALSNAYARARACFARQIDAGRTWRDVR